MRNNKKGNAVVGIILLVIGGIIILFNILSLVGVGLMQDDIEKEKQRSIAVEGVVDDLRYDSSAGHYVADVIYEVDGEYYMVTLDTATSNNKPGTTMTVYCYASNPTHVVDEWNSKETYHTYRFIIIVFIFGAALVFGGLRSLGVLGRARNNRNDIDYSRHSSPAPMPIQTYQGYNDQQFNSYDPNIPYGSDTNAYPQGSYPGQQQNPYNPAPTYGQQQNTYDPASQFNSDDHNQY